jgi:hypothetical protein
MFLHVSDCVRILDMKESLKDKVEELAQEYFINPGSYEKMLVQNIFLKGMIYAQETQSEVLDA